LRGARISRRDIGSTIATVNVGGFRNSLDESANCRQARWLRGVICRVSSRNLWRSQEPETQNPPRGRAGVPAKPGKFIKLGSSDFPRKSESMQALFEHRYRFA
jgi:hypothetical protein